MFQTKKLALLLLIALTACGSWQAPAAISPTETVAAISPIATPAATPIPEEQPVRFAAIGDYGKIGKPEKAISELVRSWNVDFVVTLGDNNYPNGEADTIDRNIGQFYHDFLYPYYGKYGEGADHARFFPALGNHDWRAKNAQPYLDYFELPGNERYYDFVWGTVHVFVLDSDGHEPDGITDDSPQAVWLKAGLAAATEPWKIVIAHHPPYSSGKHGDTPELQWPFAEWGATAVFSGHDHTYERIQRDGIVYFVNGLGGALRYQIDDAVEGSQMRYNEQYGAMLITATSQQITFEFVNVDGVLIDTYQIAK